MLKLKNYLSSILIIAIIFCLLPSGSAEAASEAWDGTVDVSWYDPAADTYYIGTPAQLAGLAALCNGMVDPKCPKIIGSSTQKAYIKAKAYPGTLLVVSGGGNISDTVYCSSIDFAYKTVYLTADLDMGGRYDAASKTWSGPNWTPVGGKYPIVPEEAKGDCFVLDTRFNGVLDGQGHTVSNIYCNRFTDKGFAYSMAVGLIGYLGGSGDVSGLSSEFKDSWQPSVKNVTVGKGYIFGRRMVGGVVGRVGETSKGVIIENCSNYADVKSTDSKGVGGILGTGWGGGVIRNCYNTGSVTTTFSCPAGGICGSNDGLDIFNCYNIGFINTNGEKMGRGIGGHDAGSYTVSNCYYLQGSDDDPNSGGYYKGTSTRIRVSVSSLTSNEMKEAAFINMLNASGNIFTADIKGINNGYPVLWYQAEAAGTPSYKVNIEQPKEGGKVLTDSGGTAGLGQSLALSAEAAAGWKLNYYTINGKKINTDFWSVTGDITVSAVFGRVKNVALSIEDTNDFYLAVKRTGYKLTESGLVWVDNEPLSNGSQVMEDNILTLYTYGYRYAVPSDINMEFIDSYTFTVANAVKNPDGTYTVTGDGEVKISGERGTKLKSWLSTADTGWFNPYDLKDSYTLKSAEELAGLAYLVNKDGLSFEGITVCLGSDISLKNTDGTVGTRIWEAIGSSMSRSFKGTFDGQGYIIKDMTAYSDGSYAGLFGCCVGATIKNVTVKGSVAGKAAASYAGGIVSYASGCSIENCINRAPVSAIGTYAGGIAASVSDGSTIKACFNYGAISGTSGVGGITGVSYTGADKLIGCANFGEVTASGSGTYGSGGIAGRLAGIIDGCANYGAITSSDRYTGGLAGYATTRNNSLIKNSLNAANIYCDSSLSTAAAGSLVGYAQYLTAENCLATGRLTSSKEYSSGYLGGEIGRSGDVKNTGVIKPEVIPSFTAATETETLIDNTGKTFNAVFTADGIVIDTVTYTYGDKSVKEPTPPVKEGYTAAWAYYELGAGDITVKAVYKPVLIKGGDAIVESGTYFIAWYASGEISIGSNLDVKLIGTYGGIEGFNDLSLSVGTGTKLTLSDTSLTGEATLITLAGNNELILAGSSFLYGNGDMADNAVPTVKALGNLTLSGDGSLYITAGLNNSALSVAAGAVFSLTSGNLTIYKDTLLGVSGGALYANGAEVIIKGGSLTGRTGSDNVSIISAEKIRVSGGQLRLQAEYSPLVLEADSVILSGGTVLAAGHSGKGSGLNRYYYSEEAIKGLKEAVKGVFIKPLPFDDVFVTDTYYTAVKLCCEKGWFKGTTEASFAPNGSMTRAMFVTVLYRLAGEPLVNTGTAFTDLSQDWYKSAVAWAVSKGITKGSTDTTFSPNDPVTREQAAVFLYRYAREDGLNTAPQSAYKLQGPVSSWAKEAIGWAQAAGLFKSETDIFTKPQENATRSLLALGLYDYFYLSK